MPGPSIDTIRASLEDGCIRAPTIRKFCMLEETLKQMYTVAAQKFIQKYLTGFLANVSGYIDLILTALQVIETGFPIELMLLRSNPGVVKYIKDFYAFIPVSYRKKLEKRPITRRRLRELRRDEKVSMAAMKKADKERKQRQRILKKLEKDTKNATKKAKKAAK